MEVKPTLLQLRRSHNHEAQTMITSQQLAAMAVVSLSDEFQMELGRPTDALVANRIMNAFSTLASRRYTLADVAVQLKGGETHA